jgi:hypothetical protein
MTAEEKRLKRNAYMREWQRRNPEKVNAQCRKWYHANLEKVRAQRRASSRRYRAANKDRERRLSREAHRRWRAAHPERVAEWQRLEYIAKRVEKCERQFNLRVRNLSASDKDMCRALLEFKRWCRANGYSGLKQLLASHA